MFLKNLKKNKFILYFYSTNLIFILLKLFFLFINFLNDHPNTVNAIREQPTTINHRKNGDGKLDIIMRNNISIAHCDHGSQAPIKGEHIEVIPLSIII